MDYPDVTSVVQVGLPQDKASYVHRLGRTARGGKGGDGVLLLCDFEKVRDDSNNCLISTAANTTAL